MIQIIVITILIFFSGLFQDNQLALQKEIPIKSEYITTDHFGNLYSVKGSSIKKYDQTSNKTVQYDDKLFGQIYSVDITDPFRILIFNRDFNKISYLDKNLSELISPILIDDLGYYDVGAVCQSNNGGFWIFDQNLIQLVYFDKNLKESKKSTNFATLIGNMEDINNIYMLEKNDYIYVGIYGEGIFLFDYYGTYIKSFPLKEFKSFQVVDETIIYVKNNKLILYNTQNFEKETIDLPGVEIIDARLERNKVIIQNESSISIYQLGKSN